MSGRSAGLVLAFASLLVALAPAVDARASPFIDPALQESLLLKPLAAAVLLVEEGTDSKVATSLNRLGIEHHHYDQLDMFGVLVSRASLAQVAGIDGVQGIWANEVMRPYLSKSAAYIGADLLWNQYKVTGGGPNAVTAMVVDTGIDGSHPDVRYKENLIENVVPTCGVVGALCDPSGTRLIKGYAEGMVATDGDGHGTHVASIAGGTAKADGVQDPNRGKYRGIAWGGKLVGFQAGLTDDNGDSSFESLTVLEAFNYALARKDDLGIRVITNSWGANGNFDGKSPINQATLKLYLAGLTVIFAAGNEGSEGAGSLNKYSVAPWVLSVGGGNYLNQRASFSSYGKGDKPYDHVDLLAPGAQITAAKSLINPRPGDPVGTIIGTLPDPTTGSRNLYTTKSGTSMAAPHVAGLAAVLLSHKPDLSPDDIYDILTYTATPLRGPIAEVGAGYLDGFAAYQLAVRTEGTLDTFLKGIVKYAGPRTGDATYSVDPVSLGYGNGTAREVRAPDITVEGFAEDLVTTGQGIFLAVAATVLTILAYGYRRGA